MLDMKIFDYRITSDSRQVILSKALRNEDGELYERKLLKAKWKRLAVLLATILMSARL